MKWFRARSWPNGDIHVQALWWFVMISRKYGYVTIDRWPLPNASRGLRRSEMYRLSMRIPCLFVGGKGKSGAASR